MRKITQTKKVQVFKSDWFRRAAKTFWQAAVANMTLGAAIKLAESLGITAEDLITGTVLPQ